MRDADGSHPHEGQAQGPLIHSTLPPVPTERQHHSRLLHCLMRSSKFTRVQEKSGLCYNEDAETHTLQHGGPPASIQARPLTYLQSAGDDLLWQAHSITSR